MAFLAADAGAFAALGVQDAWVAGVGVAPAQVGVQSAGQGGVAGVVGVEPTTNRLTVYCANHCATPQHMKITGMNL